MNTRVIRWLYRLSNLGLIFVLVTGLALGSARPVEAVSPIYVDDDWVGTTPGADPDGDGPAINFSTDSFATIQEGVTAVDAGGTVQVYAGTYTEQISINKNLTLTGEDRLTTIIEAPAVMSEACNTSDLLPNRPILCVTGGAIATIQGFTFDGLSLGSTNLRLTGVAFRNAGGVFQDNIIRNIRFSGLSSAQEGVGFYLFNSDLSPTRDIQILNNTIQNFNKNGITLTSHEYWSPATFLIQGNTISGITPNSTIAQNGIQIELVNGSGTVSGNTISNIALNNTGKPDPLVASSIYVITTPVTTSGNTISGAQSGVYYFDGVGLISENTISVVKPGVNAYGIVATDPPWAVPSPYDSAYNPGEISQNGLAVAGPPPPISVEVAGNTISFSGAVNTNTAGITSEAGLAESDLDINFHDNSVSGFENGFGLYYCVAETCPSGRYTGLKVIGNNLSGNTNAIKLTGVYRDLDIYPFVNPEIHHNRIVGNTIGIFNDAIDFNSGQPIPITAENNWWGCNDGPDAVGCDVSVPAGWEGSVDFDPWLVMTAAAIPGPINLSATAPFTVDLNHNSALALLTPGDAVPATVPVSFSVTTLGSVLPTAGFYTSGEVTTTFTAPTSAGTYAVCGTTDNQSVCSSVTVEDFNDPPIADNQSVSTPYQTDLDITLTMSDVDGGSPVTWTVIDAPLHGSLRGTAPNLTYTPDAGYSGSDSFTFKVNDGGADSNVATVTITVAPQVMYSILLPVILK